MPDQEKIRCISCGWDVPVYDRVLRPRCPGCRSPRWWMRAVEPVPFVLSEWDRIYLRVERIAVCEP